MSAKSIGVLLLPVVCAFSCAENQGKHGLHGVEPAIQRIESGLVEFRPGGGGGQGSSSGLALSDRMAHYLIPGVSVAVINGNDISWVRSYGMVNANSPASVTTDTLFQAASTTKLIVAAIALRLVEQGLIDLDEDVNKRLKSWKIPESEFTADRRVTLRLLMTHQAGLNRPDGGFKWKDVPTIVQLLDGAPPSETAPASIEYVPGGKWQYSNYGYLIIQLLLEDVTGRPLQGIAREIVFEPLGMRHSTFVHPLPSGAGYTEAYPHDERGVAHEPEMHPTAVGNGGLMTTPGDLARFTIELMKAYVGESDTILSRKMVREMFRKELDLDPALLGLPISEGLGVLLRGEGRSLAFLHPGDNLPGSSCWLVGYPETGQGAVIMTNGARGNMLAMEILPAIGKEYGWPE